jgi:hypothetical protein
VMKVSDRRCFWVLVTPAMLYWVISPTLQALGVFRRNLLSDTLIFLNTALLICWLKYREHLFRGHDRQGRERWVFYLLAALSVIWVTTAALQRRALEGLTQERPLLGMMIRTGAAVVLIAYMSLWGHVKAEPVVNRS